MVIFKPVATTEPVAMAERVWPRPAPRVLLGFELLLTWCFRLVPLASRQSAPRTMQ